jgi:hypothetical protein
MDSKGKLHECTNLFFTKKVLIAVIACALISMLYVAFYCGSVLYIKKIGISLQPSEVYEPRDVSIFMQNDERWAGDSLGGSRYTMGGSGCLVSALASASKYYGIDTDPGQLNKIFTQKAVYTDSGDVIWYMINRAVPALDYRYQRTFGRNRIQKDLEEGLLPVVRVRYRGSGIYHWVLIIGSDKDDFLIMDPLSREIITLGMHGRVYQYCVLFPVAQEKN